MRGSTNTRDNLVAHSFLTRRIRRAAALLAGVLCVISASPGLADGRTLVNVQWGSPVPVLTLKPGDKVRILYQYHSSDVTVPESVEQEPLIMSLSSPTGFASSSAVGDEYQTVQIDSVPPDPNGAPTLNAYISGFDSDESAFLIIDVNPQEAVKKTAQQIANYEAMARAYHNGEVIAEVSEHLCPPVKGCEAMERGLAALYGAEALKYEKLAQDPPDSNYTEIALPLAPNIPLLAYDPAVPNQFIDTANKLFENQSQAIGLESAILTTLNRATGAMVAQDTVWQQRQTQAAADYLWRLADVMNDQATLNAALADGWATAGLPSIVPSATQLHAEQLSVYYNGFPADQVDLLTQLGLSSSDIEYLRQTFVAQNYFQAAGLGGFPGSLTNSDTVQALHNAAGSLADSAVSTATPLAQGTKLHGEGDVSQPDDSSIHFEFNAEVGSEDSATPVLKGHLELHTSDDQLDIDHGTVTAAATVGNLMMLEGSYETENHEKGTYRILAEDNSRNGRGNDTFYIHLENGFHAYGVLDHGDIKIVKRRSEEDDD